MNEPFLAHSEITNEIYIIYGKKKYCVTDQVISAMKATGRLSERSQDSFTSLIDELCNDYCKSCCLIYKSSGCADCTCAHVREIIEGEKG